MGQLSPVTGASLSQESAGAAVRSLLSTAGTGSIRLSKDNSSLSGKHRQNGGFGCTSLCAIFVFSLKRKQQYFQEKCLQNI